MVRCPPRNHPTTQLSNYRVERSKTKAKIVVLSSVETLAGQAAPAVDSATLSNDLRRSNVELIQACDMTIEGWSRALDLRDKETEGHSHRVTETAMNLARAWGMSMARAAHVD